MSDARDQILSTVNRMKVGQRVRFAVGMFREAFPTHSLFEDRPPIDQLLEKLIGSNYGTFTAEFNLIDGHYEVARHEPGEKIIRRDWDRRHIPLPRESSDGH